MSDEHVHLNITVKLGQGFEACIADHDMFVVPGITDVEKMRDEAYRRQQGDYYAKTESTVIHFHRFEEPCDQDPNKHQVWLRKEKE